jgi:hypothetical protein
MDPETEIIKIKNIILNLFLLEIITINTPRNDKVTSAFSGIGDLSRIWLSLWFYCSQNFKLFGFSIFRF